jgi:fibronectin-binding autotransporter adhesin
MTTINRLRLMGAIIALGLILGLLGQWAQAATYTWSNSGTAWSAASNWGGTTPSSTDIGQFASSSYTNPTVDVSSSLGQLYATGSGPLSIGGANTLTLYGISGTGIQMDTGAGALSISAPVALNAAQFWTNNSASSMTVSGPVASGGNPLTVNGSGNVAITGGMSGAGGLTVAGPGMLSLTATSSSSAPGTINLAGGTLALTGLVITTTSVQSFTSVGTTNWTDPTGITSVRYLVVGGGGAGGSTTGGGGGAGGFLTGTTSVTPGSGYSVTVGSGGVGVSGHGGNGGNSVFGSFTVIGGGGGGSNATPGTAQGGGSGGGGSSGLTGGTATSGQGNAGGNSGSFSGSPYPAGGGGGAGTAGSQGSVGSGGGAGGAGLASDITGATVYYAGGGGGGVYQSFTTGGTGGLGGGGTGAGTNRAPTAGLANSGGGGGGQGNNGSNGAAGGSGIVVLSWVNAGLPVINLPGTNIVAAADATLDLGAAVGDHTLGSLTLAATGNPSLTIQNANSLTLSGIAATGTSGTATITDSTPIKNTAGTIDVPGGATLAVNAVLANGNGGSAQVNSVNKTSAGTLILFGNNTYTGGTILNAGGLVLNNNNALSAGALTINGGTLDSTVGVALPNNAQNWNADFTFNGTQNLNLGTGAVTMSSSRTVTVNGSNLTVGGAISGTGTYSLTKAGTGTLTLGGGNTFSGGLTVNAGRLVGTSASPFGTGTITVNTGGFLSWTNAAYNNFPCALTIAGGTVSMDGATQNAHNFIGKTLTMQGGVLTSINGPAGPANDGGFGNFILNGSTLTVAGAAQSTISTTTFQSGATSYFNVGLTGAPLDLLVAAKINGGAVNKIGLGTMALTGANTYTGATNINQGTLQLGNGGASGSLATSSVITNNGTLAFNRNNTVVQGTDFYGGSISGTGSLTQMGPGTLVLNGGNTYNGATTVSGGALYLNEFSQTTGISVAGGGTLGGNGSAFSATANVANGGILDFSQNSTTTFSLAGLNLAGSATINLGGLANFTAIPALSAGALNPSSTSGLVSIYANLGGQTPAPGTYKLISYTGSIGGAGSSAFTLAAVIGLGNRQQATLVDNTNELDVSVTGFTPYWNGSSANWAASNAWTLQPGGTLTTFLPGDSDVFDDSASTSANGGNVALNTGNVNPGSVLFSNNALAYSLNGSDGITGSATLAVNGGGTVTIATSNNYTGGTTLNNGLLNLANSAAIGSGPLTLGGGTLDNTSGSPMTLPANNAQHWNGGFTFAGSSPLNTGSGAVTMNASPTATVANGTLTVGGAISGIGALTKNGSGALVLTGSNGYTGGTAISAGTLQIGAGGSGGSLSPSGTISNNATLVFNRGDNIAQGSDFSGSPITGSGSLVQAGPGAVTLAAANLYTGGTTVNGGTLNLSYNSGGNGTIYDGLTINPGGTVVCTVANALGYSGSSWLKNITINGGALMTSSTSDNGWNTTISMTAGTMGSTVPGGYFSEGYGLSAGNGATINVNAAGIPSVISADLKIRDGAAGSLLFNVARGSAASDLNVTGNILVQSAGGITLAGNGIMVLSGSNTYTGGTTVNGGTLQIGNGGTTGSLSPSGTITNNSTLVFNRSDNISQGTDFSAAITGYGSLVQIGPGMVTLTAANAYTGPTTISGGTLAIGNGGAAGSLSTFSDITTNATLAFNRNGSVTQGTDFSGNPIAGTGGLTQMGPGTLVLNAANTYIGPTTVNGGALYLNAANNATTSISVASGGTLGGTGSATAAGATIANGGVLDLGQNAGSTFALASMTFAGSATIHLNDAGGQYAATPAISAGTLSTASAPINLYINNVPAGSGTMQIVQYSGAIGGSGSSAFHLASPVNGGRNLYSLVNAAGYIDLNYSTDYPYWTGAGDATWNLSSTGNWNKASDNSATTFMAGDNVVFDDRAGSSTPVVTIDAANVAPNSVTFGNSTASYTLQGSRGITGSATLAVNGGGSVTIANSNNYTGGTTLSNGLLNLANSAALGAGPLTISGGALDNTSGAAMTLAANNAQNWTGSFTFGGSNPLNLGVGAVTMNGSTTITASGTGALTVGGVISGAGALTKNGGGTLVLTASNSYSGATTITAGTLQLGVGGTTGSLSPSGTIADNGKLVINRSGSIAQGTDFSGSEISGTGGVVLTGGGTLTLSTSNTFAGGLTINAGKVVGAVTGALGQGPITVNAGGYLSWTPYGYNSFPRQDLNIIGGTVSIDSGDANAHNYGGGPWGNGSLTMQGGVLTSVNGPAGPANDFGYGNLILHCALQVSGTAQSTISMSTLAPTVNGLAPSFDVGVTGSPIDLLVSSVIQNSGASAALVTKDGLGRMALIGSNTYTGATSINAGTLQLGDGTPGHDGSIDHTSGVTDNGALVYDLAGSQAIAYAVNGNGSLAKTGTGTLTLSGTNGYTGGTTVNDGTLIVGNSEAIYDGTNLSVGNSALLSLLPEAMVPAATVAGGSGLNAAVAPVPEPGTLALLAFGLWSAAIYRRFRRTYSSRGA